MERRSQTLTDPHRHHPAVLAQIIMTISNISGGRFILGLGAGEAFNLEAYGFDYGRPVSRIAEFVRVLWESGGKPVSYERVLQA
ncbi:MAG: LLM class flavin-dependent oxidoreductase [Candidatus Freyarchaeota archaeon]|nr:LLM class flavin-dependent oxidoreductase [Candidatus Freyrarchaeum guaymaensis]